VTTIALAGAGELAVVHGLAAQALGLRVSHVASSGPDDAAERARQLGAQACSIEELPAGADLVIVTTPPPQHASDVLRALRAGAAVLVDSPLASTLAEADAIVDAARDAGPVIYGEHLLFAPIMRAALARICELGPIQRIEVRSLHPPAGRTAAGSERSPGVLVGVGAQPLAVALAFAAPAEPTAVRARLEPDGDPMRAGYAEIELRFASGLVAVVVVSRRERVPVWDLQVSSTTGVLRAELLPTLALEHNGELVPVPAPSVVTEVPQLVQFGYLAQLEAAAALAAGRRVEAPDAHFGRLVVEVLSAAHRSAAEGSSWQDLPFDGPRDHTRLVRGSSP
jgi:predicted dehydrogenase